MSTVPEILARLSAGEIEQEEAAKLIATLNSKKSKTKEVTYKVSPKGAISFYGLQKFPITTYKNQLVAILNTVCGSYEFNDEFNAFLTENNESLNEK